MLGKLFCLLVAIAGWYYLFFSKAADRLESIEGHSINRRRVRLRKTCGFVMLVLAASFYALLQVLDRADARTFLLLLLTIAVCLVLIVILAMIDVRLTWKLRRRPPS